MKGKKMKLFNESGRSMIEMLGVLAVIGVLSVTGLYGYTLAMRKHKVNEIIRELNMRANQVSTQLLIGFSLGEVKDLDDAFLAGDNYKFDAAAGLTANQFRIIMKGTIPDDVCRQLYLETGTNSIIHSMGQKEANYTSADDCEGQSERAALYFSFDNDMTKS